MQKERQLREKKLKQALETEKQMRDRYRAIFRSPQGQMVLEDLKKSVGYGKTLYTLGQPTQDLHFLIGRQSFVNELVAILSRDD